MNSLERRILTMPLKPVRLMRKRRRDRRGRRDDEPQKDEQQQAAGGGKEEEEADDDKEESEDDDKDKDERDEDGPGTIQGYAAVFHSDSEPGTEYELWSDPSFRAIERVAAGAFRAALDRPDDVRGLYNHEPDALLGRTGAGTMRLEEDGQGLRYEIDLPDTQAGRDVAELVDRGDLTGSSFGFVVESESWRETEEEGGMRLAVRTIESVRLLDVGPVTYPAYAGTSAGRSQRSVRALGSVQEARDSYARWREARVPLEARLAAARARAVRVQCGE